MGRVPDLKRLTVEDFKSEDRPLVSKLAFIINSFHEQVRSTLNRNIDSANLAREIRTLDFVTNESGQPLNTLTFRSELGTVKVSGINVIRLVITSENLRYPTTLPLISFSQNDDLITINNITGLESGLGYTIVLETITT